MNRSAFEDNNEARWREMEASLDALNRGRPIEQPEQLPRLFREVCGDLALAQHRMYGRKLCERLNVLVIGIHQHMLAALRRGAAGFLRFFAVTFPSSVRSEWRVVGMCFALFWVPFGAFIAAAYYDPKWIYAILSPLMQVNMDAMYGSDKMGDFVQREFGSSFGMFGFYIINNVSINFRIFASAALFGVGAVWGLGYQGVIIGAMFGYVHHAGSVERLYTFAASHSSFELLGFVLGGAAGMRIGLALVHPGRLLRGAAVTEAAKRAMPLLLGSTAMILVAAVIEAFWSASDVPRGTKYAAGIAGWVLFAAYFLLAGRRAREA